MSNSVRVAAVQQRVLKRQQQVISSQKTALERQAQAIVALEAEHATMRAALRRAGLLKQADTDNPANPVEEPAAEGPAVDSTDEALGELNEADVTDEGVIVDTPRATVQDADLTSVESLPSVADPGPDDTADVTAPTEGTQEQRPLNETKIETDVRVDEKTPGSEGTMFDDDNLGPAMTTSGSKEHGPRLIAAMRLGRARIAAGIADDEDDLALGQQIAQSNLSDEAIRAEIDTLEKVKATASKRTASNASDERTRRLVPKPANGKREAASFSQPSGLSPSGRAPGSDEFLFD